MLAFEKRASVQKKAPVEKIDQIYTDKRSAVSVKKVAATQYSITEPSKPSVRSIPKSTHTVVPKPISRKATEDRSHESKSQNKVMRKKPYNLLKTINLLIMLLEPHIGQLNIV